MIKCSKCNHEELEGTLFCSECGARLIDIDPNTFVTAFVEEQEFVSPPVQEEPDALAESYQSVSGKKVSVSLRLIDSGKLIKLDEQKEYSLGRVADGQLILPDVDLSGFDAYAQGVSRLHASLKVKGSLVAISDLASSNGTRVNGQRIGKHIDYPLSDGDVVALGKFKIQVNIKSQ